MIMFFGTLDSVTIANRDALLARGRIVWTATKPERVPKRPDDRVELPQRTLGRT